MNSQNDELSLLRFKLKKILADKLGMRHALELSFEDDEVVRVIESKIYSLQLAVEFLEKEYKKLRKEHDKALQEQFSFLRKEEQE
jgi:hypothetical protein